MTVTAPDLLQIATDLVHTGAVTLPNGVLLQLVRDADCDTRIGDFDCYGQVAPVAYDRDTGYPQGRPAGFNGMAQKISDAYGQTWWWQPTPSLWGIDPAAWLADHDQRRRDRQQVCDLLSFGFMTLAVEVCDGIDFFGRPIVRHAVEIGGVETFCDDSDLIHIVCDLVREIPDEYRERR